MTKAELLIIVAIPETITYDLQPYGCVKLGSLKLGSYNGYPTLQGVVIEGRERSRLFQSTIDRDVTGEFRTIYGIKNRELTAGHVVRVAT